MPVCAVGLYLAWRALPADAPVSASTVPAAARPRFDLVGLLLVAPAMTGVLLGLSNVSTDGGFGHRDVLLPLVTGLTLLAAFAAWTVRRTSAGQAAGSALVNVRLLRVRSVGASSAALFLAGACMYGAMLLLPLYYQELRGFSVLDAALVLIPQGVGSLLTRTVTGRLTDRIGGRAVAVAGFVLVALATVPFALAGPGASEWWLGAVLLVRGLGLGIVLIPVMTVAFADIDSADVPDASMITRISQQVGGSFGVATAAVVLQSALASGHAPGQAFDQAFWWTTGFTALAMLASFFLPGRRAAAPAGIGSHSGQRPRAYTDGMTEMTTIKVSGSTRDRLKRLADEEHLTMDAALSRVLDQAEDARFWQGVRADYARLQADPSAWAEYAGELAEWDAATSDGLPDE